MQFLMGVHSPELDLEDLTHRYVHLMMWRGEMRWHPELITRQRVEGFEHLKAAHRLGRGVIVNFMHHGFYDGLFGSLSRLGVPVAAVATPSMFAANPAPWLRQQHAVVSQGAPALNGAIGSSGILEELARGRALGIATDVPSSSPMTFMGRRVRGASGAARLAHRSGAPMVMVTAHPDPPDGSRPTAHLRVTPPLFASDHGTPERLLKTMLRHHEEAVAAWPEASDQPLVRWHHETDSTGWSPQSRGGQDHSP